MKQPTGLLASDFELRPALYWTTVAIMALAVILAMPNDFGGTWAIAGWLDVFVLASITLSIVLYCLGRIGRNVSLGIAAYASIVNFMAVGVMLVTSGKGIAANTLYNVLFTSVFMGVSGFIIQRFSSLVVGFFAIAFLVFAGVYSRDAFLLDNLPTLIPLVLGFSLILFYYRGSLEQLLKRIRETQNKVIAQEKLASLGSLTAGIAHEIKNPLNFITNFAESSIELMGELKAHLDKVKQNLPERDQEDVDYLIGELEQNMHDISTHGQRGDRIVKSMLMHSRGAAGVFAPEDLNILAEECLNLAFHGLRAQDTNFQSAKELVLAPNPPPVDVVRQDLSRVVLNMCNNAFYSVHQKRLQTGSDYQPLVKITTKVTGDRFEIVIQDNGLGISDEHKKRLFTPFFTTKPTGEGTGLGLSLSHDIVVQEHAGQIDVATTPGGGAQFTIRVPLKHHEQE